MPHGLLAGIPEEQAQNLLQRARRRTFAKGEVVFHRNDPADSFHLVHRGRFAVRIGTPLGDTATLGIVGQGGFFGELALIGPLQPRTATVVALERAETRSLHHFDFERLRRDYPEVTDVLLRALAVRVRDLSAQLVEALYVPADLRVLRRLHDLVSEYAAGEGECTIPLTQDELATLAGASRATVNRVLREGQQGDVLRLARGRTVITDVAALRRRARLPVDG